MSPEYVWHKSQYRVEPFGYIASETEHSNLLWRLRLRDVLYRTNTLVHFVIGWLQVQKKDWFVCSIRNNDFNSIFIWPTVLNLNMSLNTAFADISVKDGQCCLNQAQTGSRNNSKSVWTLLFLLFNFPKRIHENDTAKF